MPRLLACLVAVAGLLVAAPVTPASAAPVTPASAGHRSACTRSSWQSTLKKSEKWIIKRESNFSPTAANPTSSAFGIGQLILANRRRYAPQVGANPANEGYHSGTTDPCHQLHMMRRYIKDRYGSTKEAKKFWKRNHWY